MKTSHKSDEFKKTYKKKGGGVHKSGTYERDIRPPTNNRKLRRTENSFYAEIVTDCYGHHNTEPRM